MSSTSAIPNMIKEFLSGLPMQVNHLHSQFLEDLQPQLESWFVSLNLVTQAEFDAQTKVLHRAQKELAQLKEKVSQLESIIQSEETSA